MRVICLFRIAGMLLQVCRLGECIFVFGCLFGGIFVRLICKNLLDLRTLHLFRVFFFFFGPLFAICRHGIFTRLQLGAVNGKSDRP